MPMALHTALRSATSMASSCFFVWRIAPVLMYGKGMLHAMAFDLRRVGLMLAGLPATAPQKRLEDGLRGNQTARASYRRVRAMLERLGETDARRLYDADESGLYPVAVWIDTGVLPGGAADPGYRIGSDATRRNHYTTLVMMSTPGKCCDELAREVPAGAREFFRARLAGVSPGAGLAGAPPRAGPAAPAPRWPDILACYGDEACLRRLGDPGSPDRLIVDWWLAGGDEFPPRRRHYGDVVISRGARRDMPAGRDVLYLPRAAGAGVLWLGGEELPVPACVVAAVYRSMSGGRRRLLFQSRTGRPRPVDNSTFGHQVRAAFGRLTGSGIGISELARLYAESR